VAAVEEVGGGGVGGATVAPPQPRAVSGADRGTMELEERPEGVTERAREDEEDEEARRTIACSPNRVTSQR
jgi:hypothetical protein